MGREPTFHKVVKCVSKMYVISTIIMLRLHNSSPLTDGGGPVSGDPDPTSEVSWVRGVSGGSQIPFGGRWEDQERTRRGKEQSEFSFLGQNRWIFPILWQDENIAWSKVYLLLTPLFQTLSDLGQLEQRARRDEIEKESFQRDSEELRKRLAKTEEAKEAVKSEGMKNLDRIIIDRRVTTI